MHKTVIAAMVVASLACVGNAAAEEGAEPAGFQAWLAEQCPDGSSIGAFNAGTGALLGAVTCEDIRARALGDPSLHEQLVREYMTQASDGSPPRPPGSERVGEAREPGLISLLCGLVVGGIGLATARGVCTDPNDPDCSYGVGGGFIAASTLCEFLAAAP